MTKIKQDDHREAILLILRIASHHQGGHSAVGGEIADFLGISFPVRMSKLKQAAKDRGFDPNEVWPWLANFETVNDKVCLD